jgi:hypothetical protein
MPGADPASEGLSNAERLQLNDPDPKGAEKMNQDMSSAPMPVQPKKSNTTLIVAVVVVVLCCLCAITAGVLYQFGDQILKALGLA